MAAVFSISASSAVTSATEVSNPSKSPMRAGINFFQSPVHVNILTSPHASLMLTASRMMNSFQKGFTLLCPDASEQALAMAATASRNTFTK